jgi:hypothetical protein
MQRFYNDQAVLECRRTPWDELIFGFHCAEITLFEAQNKEAGIEVFSQFEAWAQAQKVKFAYGRFESERDVKQLVHNAGFYFAEASYRIHHSKLQATSDFDRLIRQGPIFEPAIETDHEAIRNILATDFEYSRIHEDPWVEQTKSSLRYRNWLSDLIAQRKEVYTYRLKNEVIGLHIQNCEGEIVNMVLTGVKRSHALLGGSLWAEAIRLNRKKGILQAQTVISAANIPIVNLYRRLEFQFDELLLGFHKRW